MFTAVSLFLLISILVGLLGWIPIQWRWVIMLAIFVAFLIQLGKQVTGEKVGKKLVGGRLSGILIDARNKMSLSRFQIILWTILALSAFAVIALDRAIPVLEGKIPAIAPQIAPGQEGETVNTAFEPLNIKFPEELLIAMGISTASLAGASFIKSAKTESKSEKTVKLLDDQIDKRGKEKIDQEKIVSEADKKIAELNLEWGKQNEILLADSANGQARLKADQLRKDIAAEEQKREKAMKTLQDVEKELEGLTKAKGGALGDVHTNDSIEQADWSDIFRGELVSNYRVVDPAKVQMFFFTILLVFIYGTLVWGLLGSESALLLAESVELPKFSDSLVALLGISHAGYLVVKQASS